MPLAGPRPAVPPGDRAARRILGRAGRLSGASTERARARGLEEAGARIDITGLLAVYNVVRIGQVQLFYGARLLDPQVVAGRETLELDLFDWRGIPWDELAFPSVHWVLRRAQELKDQDGPYLPLGP